MGLHTIDWIIVALFCVALFVIIYTTQKFTKSVAGFLAANRVAGRYLITVAEGMAFFAAVGVVANFENYYRSGFSGSWWYMMLVPVGLLIALSGWVTYRYRETRVLTLPQFLEVRYSKRFRIFAGFMAFFAGVLNCGIFPAVTANFIIHFCGLPQEIEVLGLTLWTFPIIMLVMITIALAFALAGGLITIMVTDFFQGLLLNIGFTVVLIWILYSIGWDLIEGTLRTYAPEGKSMINPFDQAEEESFNFWFFAIVAFMRFYMHGVWQGGSGYNAAARSAHEMRMARILAEWRTSIVFLLFVVIATGAFTFMHAPEFAESAAAVRASVDGIADPQVQTQALVPLALREMLPAGLVGLFLIVMLGASISTDDSYYHSWGSIFVQDVIMPLRKKAFTPKQHIWAIRLAITGVGAFAFFWSLFFPLKEYILMYFQVTTAVYVGGAGCAVIGGLYWSRGTTTGAWFGMISGSFLAVSAIILRIVWPHIPALAELSPEFPINGAVAGFMAAATAIFLYVAVSVLTCKQPHNMEKLLHRGRYAIPGDRPKAAPHKHPVLRLLGINEEFTTSDKVIYIFQICWTMFWIIAFFGGTFYQLVIGDISDDAWGNWWQFYVWLGICVAMITVVWFTIGGVINLFQLYHSMRNVVVDVRDDGTVAGDHNLADEPLPGGVILRPEEQPVIYQTNENGEETTAKKE